ncbi:MAG: PAS domain S-box protein, partial [Bacteroidales bacterium]|nr:PAS domain S-box protein [Bacteroidales bacterium]
SKIRNSILIRKRLNSLIFIIATLIVIMGIVSIRGISDINKKINEINVVYLENIVSLSNLVENLYAILIENHILYNDEITEISANNSVNMDLVDNYLADFEQSISNQVQRELYDKFLIEFQNYISILKEINTLKFNDKQELISEIRAKREIASFKNLQILVKDLMDYNKKGIISNSEYIHQLEKQLLTKIYLYSFIVLLLSIGIIFFLLKDISPALKVLKDNLQILGKGEIPETNVPESENEIGLMAKLTNELTSNISRVNNFAIEISKGNYDSKHTVTKSDLLGNALVNLQNNLKLAKEADERRKIEDERRNWTNKGHALFSEILRQRAGGINELTDNIIKNLVYYLNANQGGLFTIVDDGQKSILKLVSAFAYDRKKFFEREIEIGDGLIGTVALERNTIYLKEIPEDYIEIESGLGDSNPKSLIIVPLKFEEDILGVVEIASFKEFHDFEVKFVEDVAQSIASSLLTARINEQTEHLLEESRKQSEVLTEQEIEGRRNMEQMIAAQELSKIREADLGGILSAVDNTLMKGEYEIDGTLISVNDRHLKTMGYELSEIIGKNIEMFVPQNELDNFRTLWNNVIKGNPKQLEVRRKTKTGETIWLINQYTPVKDIDGKISKVLYLAHDITRYKQSEEESIARATALQFKEEELEQNINNLKNAQKEIIGKHTEISSILNAIEKATLVMEFDMQGLITNVNDAFLKMFEKSLDQMIGRKLEDFVIINRTNEKNIQIWNELKNGNHFIISERYNFSDGKNIWLDQTYTPILDSNNKPFKVLNIASDITKLKSVEEEKEVLTQQSEKLSDLLKERDDEINKIINQRETKQIDGSENTNKFIVTSSALDNLYYKIEINNENKIIEINNSFEKSIGYSKKEIIDNELYKYFIDKDKKIFEESLIKLRNGETQNIEFKIIKKNNTEMLLKSYLFPVLDEKNDLMKIVIYAIDINASESDNKIIEEIKKDIAEKNKELIEIRKKLEENSSVDEIKFDEKSDKLYHEWVKKLKKDLDS